MNNGTDRPVKFVNIERAAAEKKSRKAEKPSEAATLPRARQSTAADEATMPIATHHGILKIGDAELKCYVLNDERRVLSGLTLVRSMGYQDNNGVIKKMLTNKTFRPYMSERLSDALSNPVKFTFGGNRFLPYGYEAWVLPELCNAVVDAAEDGAILPSQLHIAIQSKLLIRALSVVGITALVDEATGYQSERAKDTLSEILKLFISEELARWAKMFPDDFYKELFRLKGLTYSEVSSKRPGFIGSVTNDIIYERLAPYVLDELKRITPKDDKGRKKHKYFQRLTEDVGHDKLREHLSNVIVLMKASPNWITFYRLLQRALPKWSDQLTFQFECAIAAEENAGASNASGSVERFNRA